MSTTFSVIVTCYNYRDFVEEAVDSALAQTRAAAQVIVVDDGSTDGTKELLERLAREDDRILVIDNAGSGVASARNAGLHAADAPLIAFLDSDNAWAPHFLELMAREKFDGCRQG